MQRIEIKKELIELIESKKTGFKLSDLDKFNLEKEFLESGLYSIIIKSFLTFYYTVSSIDIEDSEDRLNEFLQWVSVSSEVLEKSIITLKNNL